MCTANSSGAENDGAQTNAEALVDCRDCGDPTPPGDLKDGFCLLCRTQNASYLGLEDDDDIDPRGLMPA